MGTDEPWPFPPPNILASFGIGKPNRFKSLHLRQYEFTGYPSLSLILRLILPDCCKNKEGRVKNGADLVHYLLFELDHGLDAAIFAPER
jgi:hypothetical protein